MSPLLRIIKAVIDGGLTDATEVARRLSLQGKPEGTTRLEVYKRALIRLGIAVLIFPILIVIVGLIGNLGWLVAIIGIFWSLATVILLALAAPIGIILEAIIGRSIRGSGARYYKLCLGILLSELAFTLFRAVVPINNNPAAVPIVAVSAAILGILGAMGANTPSIKKIIGAMATITLIFFTFSFFLPKSFKAISNAQTKIDKGIAALIENGPQKATSKESAAKIDTVILGEQWSFVNAPSNGSIIYIIPRGEGWSAPIRLQYGQKGRIDPQFETLVQACNANGEWKTPIKAGPFTYNTTYYNGATAIRYRRLPTQDNPAPSTWRSY